jgi:hypothetical protein
MQTNIAFAALFFAHGLALTLVGCNDDRRYVGDPLLHQIALTETTPAAFAVEDTVLFVVEERIELDVAAPTDLALEDLRVAAERFELPFPRLPWVERDDLGIQVDFVLYNLDDEEREVAVIVNGFNEFHEYQPGVTVIDDEAVVDYAQWERLYALEAQQRMTRTLREEDFDEIAVDLATVVNGAPNSNEVVFFENKSSDDPRAEPYIPVVVPGLVGFRLGLRANAAANVLLEATVRVRDRNERLIDDGEDVLVAMPEPFVPVAPEL